MVAPAIEIDAAAPKHTGTSPYYSQIDGATRMSLHVTSVFMFPPFFKKIQMNVPEKGMQSRWRNLAAVTTSVLGAAPSLAAMTSMNNIASTRLRKLHRFNMFDRRVSMHSPLLGT